MGVLVIFLLIGFAVMSFVFYQKAKKLESQAGRLPPGYDGDGFTSAGQLSGGKRDEVTAQNLRLNDIISYFGQDFIIEGKIDYNEDGWTWNEFMLVDGDVVKWLSVEMDDQLEVAIWEEIDVAVGQNPPEFIEYAGQKYRQVENGSARATQTGQTGRRAGQNMRYYEYEGSGDEEISVEIWGGDVEVSHGKKINPFSLEIYPGS